MPVIQVNADLSFDQLVSAVMQLSEIEREKLLSRLVSDRPLHADHRMAAKESELMIKINEGVPPEIQGRYDELIARRDDNTLTDQEYQELLELTDQVELMDAKRLECLNELASIQEKPLSVLMDELKIMAPPVYG